MDTTASKENYLKAIAEAEAEGETVIAATLVRWLGVTPAAVTMALRRLRKDRLASIGKDGRVQLTRQGRSIAERIRLRHHLVERMLVEIFGMEWYRVHEEAERLEHAISPAFETRLIEKLGPNGVCPHGNDIRDDGPAQRRSRGLVRLTELKPGAEGIVQSVFERDRALLEYLDGRGLKPGCRVSVARSNPDETVALSVEGSGVLLGKVAATKIWVRPIRT